MVEFNFLWQYFSSFYEIFVAFLNNKNNNRSRKIKYLTVARRFVGKNRREKRKKKTFPEFMSASGRRLPIWQVCKREEGKCVTKRDFRKVFNILRI